jgi:riboflavin synthase
MFTGLVQALGTVTETRSVSGGVVLAIRAPFTELVLGESIATDGTCLTVTRDLGDGFEAHASTETLAKTTIGALRGGDRVHLERALRAGDRLGGHLVTGHVDGVGELVAKRSVGENLEVTFEVPEPLAPFLAPKGSITVDGVSLTVNGVRGARFDVMLVPFTQSETKLGQIPERGRVNLEVDVLAKYVARLLGKKGVDGKDDGGVTLDLLARHGYL